MRPNIDSLVASLRQQALDDPHLARRDLVSLARPSVRLSTTRVNDAEIRIGESRIGGLPDVPLGFEWPRWSPGNLRDDKYGQTWRPDGPAPLGFIAQIDMSAVPQFDGLPNQGWLHFFYDRYSEPWGYDPADRGCCRVVYVNVDRTKLGRIEPPDDANLEHVAAPCAVEARPELTLPDDMPELGYGTPAYESYRRVIDDLAKSGGNSQHRLLGHPQPIQNPMELECQLASNGVYCGNPAGYQSQRARELEAGASDWRLLLQIDTDEDGPGWMWGDVGRIYFWIKKQDLATLRFDDVWLVFQCC